MPSISDLSNLTTNATALSNLILITPNQDIGLQPQTILGVEDSFLFNYYGEQSIILESSITDHYIEDNTAIQDQIALMPETYNVHGFIGELNNVIPSLFKPLSPIKDRLSVVGAYVPGLAATALRAYNEATLAYKTAQNLKNAGSKLLGSNVQQTQNQQQQAFDKLYTFWQLRTLFTVQTPWNKMNNMAIKTLRAIQDAETQVITDFEITFKKIRIVTSTSLQSNTLLDNNSGRLVAQSSDVSNHGTQVPQESPLAASSLYSRSA